ncbi:uncharacterized protein LOC130549753 [Triplophysa rosa]|uniref:uncharacterized protein LOC130549753 n=1 Tax=Triplophysa rosa TaxID=992332 RepID=UPI002545E4D2|nr:uncharacterized protein LOC130549753 [Triplophysa rosa]
MAPAAKKRKRSPNFSNYLEDNRENLKSCGVRLISHVMEEYKKEQNMFKAHVNEILHSIFFLGVIYSDGLTPDKFLSAEVAESLRQEFPEPFDRFNSHLPKRTPFSILLDMMVRKYETEDNVMKELRDLLKRLKFPHPYNKPGNKTQHIYTLESTVICVCFNSECPSKKYFGASLGCKRDAKNIMIFSSCINTWHMYVSFAVMSFTQTQENGLHFPEHVKCQAHLRNWQDNTYMEIPPCKNCQNIFNLPGEDTNKKHYPYGNCAETECLSKLLFQDNSIRENTTITNYTQDNMTQLKEQTENDLRNKLSSIPSISSMTNSNDLPVFNLNW